MTTLTESAPRRTLFDISEDLRALEQELDRVAAENEGDVTAVEPIFARFFADLGAERDEKIDNYCQLIVERKLRAAARRAEMERLAIRVRADEAEETRMHERLKQFFDEHGMTKLETRRFKLSIVKNGGKLPLVVTAEKPEQLPQEYQRRKIEADNEKIRADLDAGKTLPFAHYGERGTRLNIR